MIKIALVRRHRTAGEAAGTVTQSHESGHGVGHTVGLAEVHDVFTADVGPSAIS